MSFEETRSNHLGLWGRERKFVKGSRADIAWDLLRHLTRIVLGEQDGVSHVVCIVDLTYKIYGSERKHTQARGHKVHRYDPEGDYLQTYPGYSEACRDPILMAPTPGCIKQAARERTLYKGFRWADLERNLPDDTIQDIGTTVETKMTHRIGHVAMLDLDRKSIIKVFPDMTAAADDKHLKTVNLISCAITRGSISRGNYFQVWHDCSQEMQDVYLKGNQLPTRKRKGATSVIRINPLSKQRTPYGSIAEVQRKLKVARGSLKNALGSGALLKGYQWELVMVKARTRRSIQCLHVWTLGAQFRPVLRPWSPECTAAAR